MDSGTEITTPDELEALIGAPLPNVAAKARSSLDPIDVAWIASSPLCLIATSAADGSCDVSPKGDPPGFVHVLDETTLAVPERPGNRRIDGFRNILTNPHAGLIFIVPGRRDTLRVNGRARLVRDAPYLDDMVISGHRPLLALEVSVDQVFFHCPRAFMRSGLWNHETWGSQDQGGDLPSRARIAHTLEGQAGTLEELEQYYGPSYVQKLY